MLRGAFVLLLAGMARAQTPAEAARELAGKIAAVARGPATVSAKNFSSLPAADFEAAAAALENELRQRGMRAGGPGEIAATLAENARGLLWVAEIRSGDERQVVMAAAQRAEAAPVSRFVLQKQLLWEQPVQPLDAALAPEGLIVLDIGRVSWYTLQDGQWRPRQSAVIRRSAPWPRDPRGMLAVEAGAFRVWLPGGICRGVLSESFPLQCEERNDPWPLRAGARSFGAAPLAPGRNYFDNGRQQFYSLAGFERNGAMRWLQARLDGRTWLLDGSLERGAPAGELGSDIAGVETPCGWAVLGSATGDDLAAYEFAAGQPSPASAPAGIPGAITALWPSTAGSAIVVARDLSTERYAVYRLIVSCPR